MVLWSVCKYLLHMVLTWQPKMLEIRECVRVLHFMIDLQMFVWVWGVWAHMQRYVRFNDLIFLLCSPLFLAHILLMKQCFLSYVLCVIEWLCVNVSVSVSVSVGWLKFSVFQGIHVWLLCDSYFFYSTLSLSSVPPTLLFNYFHFNVPWKRNITSLSISFSLFLSFFFVTFPILSFFMVLFVNGTIILIH